MIKMIRRVSKTFLFAEDVMQLFGCSRAKAYQIIAGLNQELKEKGYLFVSGRISRRYCEERYGAGDTNRKAPA